MWDRDDVDFIQSQSVPWTVVPKGAFGQGERQRTLSEVRDGGAATVVLQVRNRHAGVLAAGADVYVLEGGGLLNGRRLAADHYVYLQPGGWVDLRPGPWRTTLYVGYLGAPALAEAVAESDGPELLHIDVRTLPWGAQEWSSGEDLQAGAAVKWLRRSEAVDVMLAGMLPGWCSDAEESHPNHEESFRLHGDLLQGARGVMRAGAYSFRSPGVWHCPMGTDGGTISLIRSHGATTTDYRPSQVGTWSELSAAAYGGRLSPAVEPEPR